MSALMAGAILGILATIFNYCEHYKERILDLVFSRPLYFILAYHNLFFLHASTVCKGEDCVLISGPKDCGKSTLALTLARNGFKFLSDDDCFVKLVRSQIQLFPFQTKMGLNSRIIKRFPEFNMNILKNYRYGGKQRISLNSNFPVPNDINSYYCRMM